MSIICENEICAAKIPSVDWIHLGTETEDYRCKKCGKVTTIPTPKNQPTRDFYHKTSGTTNFQVIDPKKLIAAAEDCKKCYKDCTYCIVIEGCEI